MQIADRWRFKILVLLGLLLVSSLVTRLVFLQLTTTKSGSDFLQNASERRLTSYEAVSGVRGEIVDRNGRLLAYSSPTTSIGFRHGVVELTEDQFRLLSETLELDLDELEKRLGRHDRFVYLKRRLPPAQAKEILATLKEELGFDSAVFRSLLEGHTEYKRFYPAAEVAAHIVGYTGIGDQGQEGIELAFDADLAGKSGRREVIRNAKRQIIGASKLIEPAKPGQSLQLTIDLQLQSVAYSELKSVVEEFDAESASMVILDVRTGEVLALVNQPSYNANDRSTLQPERVRNRALLDVFEPGSTVKPFTYAAGLQAGDFDFETRIDTSPGYLRIDGHTVYDPRSYGELNAAQSLIKSSQVGTARLAMGLSGSSLHEMFSDVGFGEYCATGFPGEQVGFLPSLRAWRGSQKAILGYGYGLEVNTLQLARAYAVLADGGRQKPIRLVKTAKMTGEQVAGDQSIGHSVIDASVAHEVRQVLLRAVEEGTGKLAVIEGHRVAGKTGTTHQVANGRYLDDEYRATFAGMLPAHDPQLVAVVTVDRPKGGRYYGGEVAAPVFSRVMQQAIRVLNIAPENQLLTGQSREDSLSEDQKHKEKNRPLLNSVARIDVSQKDGRP